MAASEFAADEPTPRSGSVGTVLPLVGALIGGFGLFAVLVGVLAMGAVQRASAPFVVPVAVAAPAAAADSQPIAHTAGDAPEPDPAPALVTPIQRVDQNWANRTAAATGIPVRALLAYASATLTTNAAQPGCRLAWNTLAGIGAVESAHGTHSGARLLASGTSAPAIRGPALNGDGVGTIRDSDRGAWDGDPSWDRAVGPMQFIPATWRRWGTDGSGDGVADPNQIDDAAISAARYLCASGSLGTGGGWRAAIYTYNHSAAYVDSVAAAANRYASAARG